MISKGIFVFVAVLTAFLLIGCELIDEVSRDQDSVSDDDTDDGEGISEYTIKIVQGNLQAGIAGKQMGQDIAVQVLDGEKPVPGQEVYFYIPSEKGQGKGDAEIPVPLVLTDDDGIARCGILLGQTPGSFKVVAKLTDNNGRPALFHMSSYPKPTAGKKPICILSINDFHVHLEPWGHPGDPQGGMARIVHLFKTIRENNDKAGVATVIIDAGDDFENTLYNDVPGFLEWMLVNWDRAGMDVWQIGNHDFHFGMAFLDEKLEGARPNFDSGDKGHPMLVTLGNVDPSTMRDDLDYMKPKFETDFADTGDELMYQQSVVFDAGGIKVGVLGVVTDAGMYIQVPGDPFFMKVLGADNPYAEKATFFNPDPRKDDYIGDGIDALDQAGADVILVASHTGLGFGDRVNIPTGKDELIARYGIGHVSGRTPDLIVGGHSHVQLNHPIFLPNPNGGTTPIVQAREGGLFVSKVDGLVDVENGGMEILDAGLIQVNSFLDEDEDVKGDIPFWQEQAMEEFGAEFFETEMPDISTWLSHRAETVSGLGKLINAAFEWALVENSTPVDSAMAIPSLYRADLWPGTITPQKAYDVLPLHKMSTDGHAPDTLTILTLRPGRVDASAMGLPGTWQFDTTSLEFALEMIHALRDLDTLIPPLATQVRIQVAQMSNVEYEVDMTAPIFHHIVPGSVRVNGEPVDPGRTYTLAMVHSLASTVAYALQTLIIATADGEGFVDLVLDDPISGEPYFDTEIPLWKAFIDYLASDPDRTIQGDSITMTGETVRTMQPDLVVNSTDIDFEQAVRGQPIDAYINIRNHGMQPVQYARVRVLVDMTPWDTTDQDDYRSALEGFGEDYLGSLKVIHEQTISIDEYPAQETIEVEWVVPENIPRGLYTAHVRIDQIVGEYIDPNTGKFYTDPLMDNNYGEQVMTYFEVW